MDKIDIIKICVIIITLLILFNTLTGFYYDMKYTIRNHNERKIICDAKGLSYFKTIQISNEIIKCCKIEEGKLIFCEEFLK